MGLPIQLILGESPDSKTKLSCQRGCLPIRRLLGGSTVVGPDFFRFAISFVKLMITRCNYTAHRIIIELADDKLNKTEHDNRVKLWQTY